MEAYSLYQRFVTFLCLFALGVGGVALAAYWFASVSSPILAWIRRHGLQAAFVAPAVVCLVYVGSTKQMVGSVTYPFTDPEVRYLYDAGSYVTNDFVHVSFEKSALVPDSADFLGYFRPCGSNSDDDWIEFLATTFALFHSPSNVPFAGALTNDFQFFTTFTPGPSVHTNGVAVVNWMMPTGGATNAIVPVRTGIYVGGRRLAPNPAVTNVQDAGVSQNE